MTRRIPRLTVVVLIFTILFPGPGSATAIFDELIVLGDSLSDQGNVYTITGTLIPPPEYTDGTNSGRFTNGLNYIDYLSLGFGIPVTPSVLGGTNYAYGGARTDSHPLDVFGALSLLNQRDAYISSLGGMDANQNALHLVWAGANNLRDIIVEVSMDPAIDPIPGVLNSVANVADVVTSLAVVNANNILVPNIPDLGLVPIVTGSGPPVPEATLLTEFFNVNLDLALVDILNQFPLLNLIEFDVFDLSQQLYMDPADFGLSNVSDACYSLFVEPGGTVCSDPDEYASWDGFHPTTATHEQIAQRMAKQVAVPEPATIALLVLGLAGLGVTRHRMKA